MIHGKVLRKIAHIYRVSLFTGNQVIPHLIATEWLDRAFTTHVSALRSGVFIRAYMMFTSSWTVEEEEVPENGGKTRRVKS